MLSLQMGDSTAVENKDQRGTAYRATISVSTGQLTYGGTFSHSSVRPVGEDGEIIANCPVSLPFAIQ